MKKFYNKDFNERRKFIQGILPVIETFAEDKKIEAIQYFEPETYLRVSLFDWIDSNPCRAKY